ncbi:MAG: threonine synthase [Thermoplasmata archaeon]
MSRYELRCIECGRRYEDSRPIYSCAACGNLLEVKLDIESSREALATAGHLSRPLGVWRYRELIPVGKDSRIFTLREGGTPLLRCKRLADELGMKSLWLKFDGTNPTGSFKDRGMTVGITKAVELGMRVVTCASTGNTSASLSAYAALAGLKCIVLIPEGKVALGKLAQAMMHGAMVVTVRGNFDEALDMVMRSSESLGLYVLNSVNPFRIEGQKTAAYEICDQLGGRSPHYLYIPVGNGGNSAAYWKGFSEYEALGMVPGHPIVRGIQAEGAAPIADMFKNDRREIVPVKRPETVATAIRIGRPANWKKTVRAIRESGGYASTVSDEQILAAQRAMAKFEGVFAEPAGAAALAGVAEDLRAGRLDRDAEVVCVATGHGLKDPDIAISQSATPRTIDASVDMLRALVESW